MRQDTWEGYPGSGSRVPLVAVGSCPNGNGCLQRVEAAAQGKVRFLGRRDGRARTTLQGPLARTVRPSGGRRLSPALGLRVRQAAGPELGLFLTRRGLASPQ